MKIVLCGGHLTPALAMIEALRKEEKDSQIYFLGRQHTLEGDKSFSQESRVIPLQGVQFHPIITGRFQRKLTIHTIPSLIRVPVGFFQALFLLLKINPDVICSFGSYVAFPTVLAGWFLRIPVITHEQTREVGLASKIISIFSRKVAVSYQGSERFFPQRKVILVGNPIREGILNPKVVNAKLEIFLAEPTPPLIFITGGNQGSHAINEAVLKILGALLKRYRLVIQTGDSRIYNDFAKFDKLLRELPSNLREHFWISKYFDSNEVGHILRKADLVVGRSGANIVWELGVLGKVAIFIPIPWVQNDEQTKNAKTLFEFKAAEILPQSLLSPKTLIGKIEFAFENLDEFKKNAAVAQKFFPKDGTQKLAREILKLSKK